jgi:histidinol-phosphate aminotransferase
MSIWQNANQQLRDLEVYEPGKPIEDVARELGLDPASIVKLASNENPLGPSPKALAAMRKTLEQSHLYPDGGAFYLREAIAEKFGLKRANVILGNGSSEVIEFIAHAFLKPGDEIITARHSFVIYKICALLFGASTVEVPDPGFAHDLEAMAAAITPRTRIIFVTNPNNPTGTLISQEEIDRFLEKVPARVVVVFDEAYHEFLKPGPDGKAPTDSLKFVRGGRDNVVVLRTFSKIQGLANLRVGYGLATEEMIAILQKTRQPFNCNGIAQAGALAGLLDDDHQARTRSMTWEGLDYLEKEFKSLGLEYVPSHANFILVKVGDGGMVFKKLMERGVIIRAMGAYQLPEWIRVTVGTPEQNQRFIEELRKLL